MCSANSTQQEQEVKPAVQGHYQRVEPAHAAAICRAEAVEVMNRSFRALIGINAIGMVLQAHSIAAECGKPILASHIEGGLLDAIVCLSNYASDEIEFFADSADGAASRLNKPEVNRG